jgi:hypothetical protein
MGGGLHCRRGGNLDRGRKFLELPAAVATYIALFG